MIWKGYLVRRLCLSEQKCIQMPCPLYNISATWPLDLTLSGPQLCPGSSWARVPHLCSGAAHRLPWSNWSSKLCWKKKWPPSFSHDWLICCTYSKVQMSYPQKDCSSLWKKHILIPVMLSVTVLSTVICFFTSLFSALSTRMQKKKKSTEVMCHHSTAYTHQSGLQTHWHSKHICEINEKNPSFEKVSENMNT